MINNIITLACKKCRLYLFWRKMIYKKYFMYFMVFGTTENNNQFFFSRIDQKSLFSFLKYFLFFKTVNHFSSLNFLSPILDLHQDTVGPSLGHHLLSPDHPYLRRTTVGKPLNHWRASIGPSLATTGPCLTTIGQSTYPRRSTFLTQFLRFIFLIFLYYE